MNGRSIRLISWNVKGMNNNVKSNKVISHLQELKGDLFFLQETHLCKSESSRIKKPWMSHLFHSRFSERARGAAIIDTKMLRLNLPLLFLTQMGAMSWYRANCRILLWSWPQYMLQLGTMINLCPKFFQVSRTLQVIT